MGTEKTSELGNAWCACKDTVHDMRLRGFFKTFKERVWELFGSTALAALAFMLVPASWPNWAEYGLCGVIFIVATFVLWYLRCLHSLPAKVAAEKQVIIEGQRRMMAWFGGMILSLDESQQWVTGSYLFDWVAWAETDQNLGKIQIENRIGDEAKSGRIRVRAMPLDRSDLIDLSPEIFESHKFVLEPRTNRYVIRFGKNEDNASVWGSIQTKTNPSVKVYDCPQFERARIAEIWKAPGTVEYAKRRKLVSTCRCMSESDAQAHVAKWLDTGSAYTAPHLGTGCCNRVNWG